MTSIIYRGTRPLVTGVATLAAVASLASVAQLAWAQVDTAKSAVTATARQIGVPMEGKFRKFDATVDFDPAKLATSSAKIDIDVSSFEIGDAETSKEVKGAEQEFFPLTHVRSNFLCNLGYGDPAKLHPRNPRLSFEEACALL